MTKPGTDGVRRNPAYGVPGKEDAATRFDAASRSLDPLR